jgi:hypothetical protein
MFAAMAERWMTKVVREAQRLRQVFVETERAGYGPSDLRDFYAVGEPHPEMIAVGGDEHLRLVAQAAESDRVDDSVAVALKKITRAAWARCRFRMESAARP